MIPQLAGAKILLITDNAESGRVWTYALEQRGAEVTLTSLDSHIEETTTQGFDLVVIDSKDAPQKTFELCQLLRSELVNPIILMFYEDDVPLLLRAYQTGADDCIPKPVDINLLIAKLSVWLRRSFTLPINNLDNLQVGRLTLEPSKRQLMDTTGTTIHLTALEFRFLNLLMNNPGLTMSSTHIVNRVWGYNGEGDNVLLKNLVYRLRRKMQTVAQLEECIKTIPGDGYQFQPIPMAPS